jgi:hypothetical protein
MKNNKDRNKFSFGPRYKDLEQESRRLNRARSFESFESDLRFELGEIPEARPGPSFPAFPEVGSVDFEPAPFRFVIAMGSGKNLITGQTTDGGATWTRTTVNSRNASVITTGQSWTAQITSSTFYGLNNLSKVFASGRYTEGGIGQPAQYRSQSSQYSGFDGTYLGNFPAPENNSASAMYSATDGRTILVGNQRSLDGVNFFNMSALQNPNTLVITSGFVVLSQVALGPNRYVRAIWFTSAEGIYLFETVDAGLTWNPVYQLVETGRSISTIPRVAIQFVSNPFRAIDATNYKNGYAYVWTDQVSLGGEQEKTSYLLVNQGGAGFKKVNLTEIFPVGSVFTSISQSYDGGLLIAGEFPDPSGNFHMVKTFDDGESFSYVGPGRFRDNVGEPVGAGFLDSNTQMPYKITMTPSGYGVCVGSVYGSGGHSFTVRRTSNFGNSWTRPRSITFSAPSPIGPEESGIWGVVHVE